MHKLFFATALAAAIVVPDALSSAAAAADGFRKHHRWGDRDYASVLAYILDAGADRPAD